MSADGLFIWMGDLWSAFESWVQARWITARALPADLLLSIIAGLVVLVLVMSVIALWSRRKRRHLVRVIAEREAELQVLGEKYQAEVTWRRAGRLVGAAPPPDNTPIEMQPSSPPPEPRPAA